MVCSGRTEDRDNRGAAEQRGRHVADQPQGTDAHRDGHREETAPACHRQNAVHREKPGKH